jgi:hypothetical protein
MIIVYLVIFVLEEADLKTGTELSSKCGVLNIMEAVHIVNEFRLDWRRKF